MSAIERQVESGARAGLITFGVVFVLAFPWVNSEWKGGWLQAIGGAMLLAGPAGLVTWGIRRAPSSRRAGGVLRVLLVLAVLFSLAGIHSYGVFTAPLCLAPLWIAAWRGGPREGLLWTALSAPCWLMTGWLLSYSFDHSIRLLPTAITILGVALFLLTSQLSPPRATDVSLMAQHR